MSVLTGFKYIGEKIKQFERDNSYGYIFGYEESYGYLPGTYARDKDAVATSLLIAEMAAYYKQQRLSLYGLMNEMYEKYGYFKEASISNVVKGIDPLAVMRDKMTALRAELPSTIDGIKVLRVRDYKSGEVTDFRTGETSPTGLPSSDVLYFELEDGCTYIIRPSGTEPKIKTYILVKAISSQEADAKIASFTSFTKTLF